MTAERDTSSEWHAGRIEPGLRLRVRIRQRVLDREIAAGLRLDSDAARRSWRCAPNGAGRRRGPNLWLVPTIEVVVAVAL